MYCTSPYAACASFYRWRSGNSPGAIGKSPTAGKHPTARKEKIKTLDFFIVHSFLDHSVQITIVKRKAMPEQNTKDMSSTNKFSGALVEPQTDTTQLHLQLCPEQASQLFSLGIIRKLAAGPNPP